MEMEIENGSRRDEGFVRITKVRLFEFGVHAGSGVKSRLVEFDAIRIRQQRAEYIKLVFPMTRQPIEQSVRLRLRELEVLEKMQQQADFVEGQPDEVNQIGDFGDDLRSDAPRLSCISVDECVFAHRVD